jgi:hypothetical protein
MSPNTLALIAGLISFGSALPYIIDVARGKTHPNVVTWLTWSILNLINTATTWSAGQYQTAIVGAFTAAATLCIVVMAVDIIGGLPTLRHAWIAPFAETWQSFAIGALSGIPTFFAISAYNFVSLAFPVWITFNCVLLTAVILLRRRAAPQLATAAV